MPQQLEPLLPWIAGASLVLCVLMFARIAWVDFWTLKIANRDVLLILVPALVLSVTRAGAMPLSDIGGGLLLFGLGLAFWLLKMMGAGDAKLYFPLGIAVGWNGLALYALALMFASLLLIAAVRLGPGLPGHSALRERLDLLKRRRTYPYGVPMSVAAVTAMCISGI